MWGWGRRRSDLDEREEVIAHVRLEADRLIDEEGCDETEAMRRARARFGHHEQLDPTEVGRRMSYAEIVARDVRHAVRRLSAQPISTTVILASLMIGIGVNTAIFSLADQTLVRPMPVTDPDRIVQLSWEGQWIGEGRGWGSLLPHPLFVSLAEEQSVFSSIAARSPGDVTIIGPAGSERARIALVTGDYFELLGLRPHLGRLIGPGDDQVPDGHPVVVLSHAWWTARYGADSTVVGRQIQLNGRPMSIIGVAPRGFYGTDWSRPPAMWTSMMMNDLVHSWGGLDEPRIRFQHIYARLAEGVSRTRAEREIQPWFGRYVRQDTGRDDWPADLSETEVATYLASRLALLPGGAGQADRAEELRQPVIILSFATALLLLLACLNVANLSLASAVARYRETAVRTALGASRGRIMVERFVESGLLALTGGTAGVLAAPIVAAWILDYLEVGGAGMAISPALSGRMLLTALLICVVATVLSGIGPAWFASSTRPMGALRTRSSDAGVRLRRALVVGQVALALVLLTGAALFGSTLRTLRGTGPGFETEQLITFAVNPRNDGRTSEESKILLEEILLQARGLPGIEAAGLAAWPLLHGSGWGNSMLVEAADGRFVTPDYLPMNAITPDFFDVLGVKLLRGRGFTDDDRTVGDAWSWDRVIVSQSFVEEYLPSQDPLGVRIDFIRDLEEAPRLEIVGVVEDYAEQRLRDPKPQVYFPMWQQVRGGGVFYARTRLALSEVGAALRGRIQSIDPTLTVADMRTLDEEIDRLLVFERMLASLGAAFALFGTLLAMIGIYGVLSFSVQARRKEVGIRMALGSPTRAASRLVVTDALRLTLWGIAVAVPAIWFLGGLVRAQLYGVSPLSPPQLLSATVVILLLCLVVSTIPAWRMARTDPLEAFRVE